jgi:hypothetical protein
MTLIHDDELIIHVDELPILFDADLVVLVLHLDERTSREVDEQALLVLVEGLALNRRVQVDTECLTPTRTEHHQHLRLGCQDLVYDGRLVLKMKTLICLIEYPFSMYSSFMFWKMDILANDLK